ncbi:MAG: hypothetical protein NXI04_03650 [Planctomycetaceae bacterium]|nr:hypothetical protein [Planctomycetaceae bacterium]
MRRPLAATLTSICLTSSVAADTIDFENAADYGGDDAVITADYFASYGLTVTAYSGKKESSASLTELTFEATGRDGTDAFHSGNSIDTPNAGDMGNYFLKAGVTGRDTWTSKYFNMSIDYDQAASAASAQIWDIDRQEQYKVTAFDANGTALASLTSPSGGLDGEAWVWAFDMDEDLITKIDIEFVGRSTMQGFALDNFQFTSGARGHAAPVPPSVALGMAGLGGTAWMRRRQRLKQNRTAEA